MYGMRHAGWLIPFLCSTSVAATSGDLRLVEAVKNSDRAAVRTLLQKGADVNASEIDGTTALHWAVNRDDLQTVELLLGAGANVKVVNRYGVNPLLIACNNASAPVVVRLLKA